MAKVFNDQNVGETLQHFVDRAVRPTETEMNNFGEEVHTVVQFLQTELLTAPYKVAEVYKGGSLKKGTAVRDSSDIDLVVFVNGLEDIKDLQRERKKLLKRIRQKVNHWKWPTVAKPTIKKYGICCKIKEHTVDILPAFDAVEKYGSPSAVYAAMEHYRQTLSKGCRRKHNVGMQFSASLSPLQADFIKEAPGNVKDVIRLLKKWKKGKRHQDPVLLHGTAGCLPVEGQRLDIHRQALPRCDSHAG